MSQALLKLLHFTRNPFGLSNVYWCNIVESLSNNPLKTWLNRKQKKWRTKSKTGLVDVLPWLSLFVYNKTKKNWDSFLKCVLQTSSLVSLTMPHYKDSIRANPLPVPVQGCNCSYSPGLMGPRLSAWTECEQVAHQKLFLISVATQYL